MDDDFPGSVGTERCVTTCASRRPSVPDRRPAASPTDPRARLARRYGTGREPQAIRGARGPLTGARSDVWRDTA